MAAYQTSYENDNANAYKAACDLASKRTLTKDYCGCALHVCARVEMVRGAPLVTGYHLSDWYDSSVVCTYCNGQQR